MHSRRAALTAVFPRQFWLLAADFFVLLSGIDMCYPFETTYLNGRLHVSMTVIGLVLGLPLSEQLRVDVREQRRRFFELGPLRGVARGDVADLMRHHGGDFRRVLSQGQ